MDSNTDIGPVATIPTKRLKKSLNWNLCVICQKKNANKLYDGTSKGCDIIRNSYETRVTHGDMSEYITHLQHDISDLISHLPKWHKECYSSFTSKLNIQRVIERYSRQKPPQKADTGQPLPGPSNITRGIVPTVDWKLCIYCQTRKKKEGLHQVLSENANAAIHEHANTNITLKCRIGVNDLIAYEAHYHSSCRRKADRAIPSTSSICTDAPRKSTFMTLINMLEAGFSIGYVYSMDDVVAKFNALLFDAGVDEPVRSQYLKEKLLNYFGDKICFRRQRDMTQPLLLFSNVSSGVAIEALKITTNTCDDSQLMDYQEPSAETVYLNSLNHVASKISADLQATPGHSGYDNLSMEAAESCIPDSLYTLVKWIVDPQARENDPLKNEGIGKYHQQILNVCQTIVYAASKGRKNTPKHIGTGLYVYHATRSKHLVNYLHGTGDGISYDMVKRISTSIASQQLERYVDNDNTFLPQAIVPGRFIQFSADNLDLLEETLDGKGTFHVTQMAAFQRGPQANVATLVSSIRQKRSLQNVPREFHEIIKSETPVKQVSPQFAEPVNVEEVFQPLCDSDEYKTHDLAWMLTRLEDNETQTVPAWTGFNQTTSTLSVPTSIISYLPIIQAPAHQLDTIFTVLLRCKKIAAKLGQHETVVTVDEALYCKAKELVWANCEQLSGVVVRLGGFHITKNFLGVIGKHMEKSGLADALVESGVYNQSTVSNILSGKSWNRAVRAHKLTLEALMRILFMSFRKWQDECGKNSYDTLAYKASRIAETFSGNELKCNTERLKAVESFKENAKDFFEDMEEFTMQKKTNPTFVFWKQYMDMVHLLLHSIRAEREGNWNLHLDTFRDMLSWITIYDHVNYARWGVIYLADMLQLEKAAPNVYKEFVGGNFVVKESAGSFNQVHTDMALEHINKLCKVSGGIIGITRNKAALDRWMLTCCDLSRLSEDARVLAGLSHGISHTPKDLGIQRIARDEADVAKLLTQFWEFNPFDRESTNLICISSNDVAPSEVMEDILSAQKRGEEIVKRFVRERLGENPTVAFRATLPKQRSKTFATLSTTTSCAGKKRQMNVVKCDRDLFKRLFSASVSGRNIDIPALLGYELADYPLSLTNDRGELRRSDKASLAHIISDEHAVTSIPTTTHSTCVIIDAMTLVQVIGKPTNGQTFGDLADVYCQSVFNYFSDVCTRVDVVFDCYRTDTIKTGTRVHRSGKGVKIRRIVDSRQVRLPSSWINFLSLEENKQDLIQFLTEELLRKAVVLPAHQELVVAGGCKTPETVVSSTSSCVSHLFSTHEEADTRIVLHASDASAKNFHRIIVYSKDTDVLLLLIYHKTASEVWMHAGTRLKPRYIPVHSVRESLLPPVIRNILAYHAITGCDSTSQFSGYSKITTWKAYTTNPTLLNTFTDETDNAMGDAEKFVIKIYSPKSQLSSINALRADMFHKIQNPEKLPPTHNSLMLHLKRSCHQMSVWKQAKTAKPNVQTPTECGWKYAECGVLVPVLTSLPSVSKVCPELVTCSCQSLRCNTSRCSCNKIQMSCSLACVCVRACQNPNNLDTVNDSDENDTDEDI